MSHGKAGLPSQVTSEGEVKSRVSSAYYLQGVEKNSLTLGAQLLSGYLKRYPRKSKVRTYGGNPKLKFLSNIVQTLGVNRIIIL